MAHPLDEMLANLKMVRDGAVEAYIDSSGYWFGEGCRDMCAAEVVLARMIFRLGPEANADYFWGEVMKEDWPELPDRITDAWLEAQAREAGPEDRATVARAWLLSLDGLLRGCKTPLVAPDTLFEAGADREWYSWGFFAQALTERLAAIGYWMTETSGPFGTLAGFADRRDLYRSTALLARHSFPIQITTFEEADFLSLSAEGLPLPELYRILLAGNGRGGSKILTLEGEALMNYREPNMAYGFEDLQALMQQEAGPAISA